MSSSEIARLKSKFEHGKAAPARYGRELTGSNAPPPATPAFFEMRQRQQKMAQVSAAKVAKQNAARYNLTLRAIALTSAKKAQDERFRNLDEVQRAKELASHYNATARAVRTAVGGVAKKQLASTLQKKISEGDESTGALSPSATKSAEAPVVEPVHLGDPNSVKQDDGANIESKTDEEVAIADEQVTTSATAEPIENQAGTESTIKVTEETQFEDTTKSENEISQASGNEEKEEHPDETSFALPEVEKALAAGDENAINVALIKAFLEENDPERARDSARLLEEYKGKEEELMQSLLVEIPVGDGGEDHAVEKLVEAAGKENVGFITAGSADAASNSWKVNIVPDAQLTAFKSQLLAKGMDEKLAERIVDDSSEML